jgi:2-enoate reductase
VPEFKKDLKKLLDWYHIQLTKLKIKIKTDTEVTLDYLEKESPDITLLATGGNVSVPKLPGIDKKHVIDCIELLLGKKEAGYNIVVLGGGVSGCEISLWLAKKGKKVTIVEMLDDLMEAGESSIPIMCRIMLMDLLRFNKVNIITSAKVEDITDKGVIVNKKGSGRMEIYGDSVILALGTEANNQLYESLQPKISNLYLIGDCRKPSNIMNAIWDAFEVGRAI